MNLNALLKGASVTEFELEMHALAMLVRDNRQHIFDPDLAAMFPVKVLGRGNFGVAFELLNYPGLVLKVCQDPSDGYPEYIRAVARLAKRKRWMPEVLAHGGCESSVFWCVMPKYVDPCEGDDNWGSERWRKAGGELIERACGHHNIFAGEEIRRFDWYTCVETVRKRPHKQKGSKAERRMMREVREFLRPMERTGANVYMHAHNALKDGDQWIITDPIASWEMSEKEAYRNAHS